MENSKNEKETEVKGSVDRDIKNLEATEEKLKNHLKKNIHDYKTKRALLIREAKLRKLKNYKKRREKS